MKLLHRVVVIRQTGRIDRDPEERETVYSWMTPDEAETFSDKIAQDLAEDPSRYVLIEAIKPEAAKCEIG